MAKRIISEVNKPIRNVTSSLFPPFPMPSIAIMPIRILHFYSTQLTFAADQLAPALASGRICLKPDLLSLSDGNLLEFVDGSAEGGIDALILCTGYQFDFDIVEEGKLLAVRHNDFHLVLCSENLKCRLAFPQELTFKLRKRMKNLTGKIL